MGKVLVIGPDYFNYLNAVRDAFVTLGWEVSMSPYDNPVHPYNGLMKVRWKVSRRKDILLEKSRRSYNEYLRNRFMEEKPMLVFILNGDMVLSGTLDFFRKNGAKVAMWMFDNLDKLPSAIRHIDYVDAMFCFDPNDVDRYVQMGKNAFFLPQACDTAIYKRLPNVHKDIDILFIGNMYYSPKRKEILLAVIKAFLDKKIVVYGLYQPWYKGIIKWVKRPYRHIFMNVNLSPKEVNYYYNRAKVVLNIHQESQINGANPRVFEISGAGAYQICDTNPYLQSLFSSGEVILYHNTDELIQAISVGLNDSYDVNNRSCMAEELVIENNTFKERIDYVLSILFPSSQHINDN